MLPWKNSWFQIALFAWIVSGALLIVDYAPKIPANSGWMKAFQREDRQSAGAPAKPSLPSEQHSPAKEPAPERQTPSPASEKPVLPTEDKSATKGPAPTRPAPGPSPEKSATKTPNAAGTNAGSKDLSQGKAALDRHDLAQAMQWLQKSAAYGNAEAEDYIGLIYGGGLGVPRDFGEAMKWWRKAAAQGYAGAEVNIGILYEEGLGVPKDPDEAKRWYQKAGAQGLEQEKSKLDILQAVRKSQ